MSAAIGSSPLCNNTDGWLIPLPTCSHLSITGVYYTHTYLLHCCISPLHVHVFDHSLRFSITTVTVFSLMNLSYFHLNLALLSLLFHFLFKKPMFCFVYYDFWASGFINSVFCITFKVALFLLHNPFFCFSVLCVCIQILRFSFSHLLVWCSFDAFCKSSFGGSVQTRSSLPVTASKWLFSRCQLKKWNSESYNSFEKVDGFLVMVKEVICLAGNSMWSVNLTWDVTWQPIFLPTRPYKPPYVLHQTEAMSQVNQRSLKSICWAHNLGALREICFYWFALGARKCLLCSQRLSVSMFSICSVIVFLAKWLSIN